MDIKKTPALVFSQSVLSVVTDKQMKRQTGAFSKHVWICF